MKQRTAIIPEAKHSGVEVNYFQAMERVLHNYNTLAALVKDYEAYIQVDLKERSTSIVPFSPSGGGTYRMREDVREEIINNKITHYHETRVRFEELHMILKKYEGRREFIVVRMYYLGQDAAGQPRPSNAPPYTWEEIADELSTLGVLRDVKSARRWRNRIVNDMAVCLFGPDAAVSASINRQRHTT